MGPKLDENRSGWYRSAESALDRLGVAGLWGIFAVELVGLTLLKWPACLLFEGFAFGDWGANLTAQALLDRGLRPSLDFYYPYGLLPLAVGRFWFAVFGRTPTAYLLAMVVCHVLIAWGLARGLRALRVGLSGVVLMVIAMPYAVPPTHPNLAHALESVLLVHALAEHARGRLGIALALALAAVLAKPSLAFAYGALLLVLILWEVPWKAGPIGSALRRGLAPAVLLGVVLLVGLALSFGVSPMARTLVPIGAAETYKAAGFGFFFGNGRNYWLPPDARLAHYLGTQRGFWIAGSILLVVVGLVEWVRGVRRSIGNVGVGVVGGQIVGTCALLHAVFVVFLFGNEVSWMYYGFLLVLGLSAMDAPGMGRQVRGLVLVLALLALVAVRSLPGEVAEHWRAVEPGGPELAGLWSSPQGRADWREVLQIVQGEDAVLLSWAGCVELLFPEFRPPVRFFLLPGAEDAPDFRRMADQLAGASLVVVPTAAAQAFRDFLVSHPRIRAGLEDKDLHWSGTHYEVYRSRDGL